MANTLPSTLPDSTELGDSLASELSIQVVDSFLDPKIDPLRWDRAVLTLGGPIYMTFDWLKTWWGFYGGKRDLRLFIFSVGDQIVGLLPLYVDIVGFGPIYLKIARIVGSPIPPKAFGLPVEPKWAADCFERTFEHLIRQNSCDLVSLGPISTKDGPPGIMAACSRLSALVETAVGPKTVHSVFELPSTLSEYLESLGKSEQKRRNYELRSLQKQLEIKTDVISTNEQNVVGEFERFATQHSAQWEAEGKPGHFGAWPEGYAYNHALVSALGSLGRVRFVRLWANDQIIANQYVFSFGGKWFWELPARSLDPVCVRFSIGSIAAVAMIEEAYKEGVHLIEGGLGHYEYKLRLKAREYPAHIYRLVSRRRSSRIRKSLFDIIHSVLRVGYQKIWYRRIVPRLPLRMRRAQSLLWLRLDY